MLDIDKTLKERGFTFNESETRMGYNYIGSILENGVAMVMIYPKTFYVIEKSFPINEKNLELIQAIQEQKAELN